MISIADQAQKHNITDQNEISALERFFNDPEITRDLVEIEMYRKKRERILMVGVAVIVCICVLVGMLGVFSVQIGKTGVYRPSVGWDGFWLSIFPAGLFTVSVYLIFKRHIEGAIKINLLTRLSKVAYEKLNYDGGAKYAFNDLVELKRIKFLSAFDQVDVIEDSIAYATQENGKYAVVQGYEVHTSSQGEKSRNITNYCYLLRVYFPSARMNITHDVIVRSDRADTDGYKWVHGTAGAILGIVLGIIITLFGISAWIIIIFGGIGFWIGYVLRSKYLDRGRVRLENAEFEKLFDIHCDDPIDTRMILTPALMDRIVQLCKRSHRQYEFAFLSDRCYIKWDTHEGYLEINTWKKLTDNFEVFIAWYAQIKEMLSFVTDMQLLYLSKTESKYLEGMESLPVFETIEQATYPSKNSIFFESIATT